MTPAQKRTDIGPVVDDRQLAQDLGTSPSAQRKAPSCTAAKRSLDNADGAPASTCPPVHETAGMRINREENLWAPWWHPAVKGYGKPWPGQRHAVWPGQRHYHHQPQRHALQSAAQAGMVM